MNKDETVVRDLPVYQWIKDRRNVLLLGDSLGDVGMIRSFDYDALLKIGFLNENIKDNLEAYRRSYNVVILNDGTMEYVNNLLKEMIS